MAKKKSSGSNLTKAELNDLINSTYTSYAQLASKYAASNQSLSAQQFGASVTSSGSSTGLGQLASNPNMMNVPYINPNMQYNPPQYQYGYTTQTVTNPLTSINLCVGCYPTARMPAMFFFQGNSLCEKCFIIKKEEKQNLEDALGNALGAELKKTLKKKFAS